MALKEVLGKLEAAGIAQNRKVYRRHGYPENSYGVSFAVLGKLAKQIGRNHELSCQLLNTGNGDAQILAMMIADVPALTSELLDEWVGHVACHGCLGIQLASVVSRTPYAQEKIERWRASKQDLVSQTAYILLSVVAMNDQELPDSYFAQHLATIEATIHSSPNWTRYSMNMAVIAIGVRNERLRALALAAAARIGKVKVDHGETGCKTPDVAAYIAKTMAHREKMTAKRAAAKPVKKNLATARKK